MAVTIDGTNGINDIVLGSSTPAAATVTTFTSNGIDDNADAVAITIDSSENVGIGTASPDAPLSVFAVAAQNIAAHLSSTSGAILQFTDQGSKDWGFGIADGTSALTFFENRNISAAGTARMTVASGGNVGIGTASPGTELEVADSGNATIRISDSSVANRRVDLSNSAGVAVLTARDGASNAGIFLQGGADGSNYARFFETFIQLYTSNTEKVRITSAGNVGIGIASPVVKLDVNGITGWGGGTTGQTAQIVGTNSPHGNGGNLRVLSNTTQATNVGGSLVLGGYYTAQTNSIGFVEIAGRKENSTAGNTSGYLAFETRPNAGNMTEHMRITSAGNVGIGTATIESGFKLHVTGNGFFSPSSGTVGKVVVDNVDQRLVLGSYYEAGIGQNSFISSTNNAETGNLALAFRTGTTERMRIDASGNVGIGTSVPGAKLQIEGGTDADQFRIGLIASNGFYKIGRSSAKGILEFSGQQQSFSGYDFKIYPTGGSVGTSALYIKNGNGNVGIGTSAPAARLHSDVSGTSSLSALNLTNSGSGTGTGVGPAINFGLGSANLGGFGKLEVLNEQAGTGSNSYMAFSTRVSDTLAEKMRIASNGFVAIGTPAVGGQLHVLSASGAELIIGYQGAATNYMDATTQIFRNASKAETMQIASSGNLELNHSLVYKGAPSTIYNADVFPNSITVANGGTVDFSNFSGYLLVCSHTSGNTSSYLAGAGSTVLVSSIGASTAGTFLGNATTAGYTWTNNTGSSHTLGFYCVRGRNTR